MILKETRPALLTYIKTSKFTALLDHQFLPILSSSLFPFISKYPTRFIYMNAAIPLSNDVLIIAVCCCAMLCTLAGTWATTALANASEAVFCCIKFWSVAADAPAFTIMSFLAMRSVTVVPAWVVKV